MANGSLSTGSGGEGDIRNHLIEADLVDCMVALPGNLFYSTTIPVCLWFLSKTKVLTRNSTSRSILGWKINRPSLHESNSDTDFLKNSEAS